MASLLELGVSTGKWDAGLKKAKQALDSFVSANGGLQQALDKDNGKINSFVKMMGQMDSTAKTSKGQLNDYKSTLEQLTMQYNRMSDAQKKTVGQDYIAAIDQIKQKYHAVAEEIEQFNKSLQGASSIGGSIGGIAGGMSEFTGMLQVFAGNMLTNAAMGLASTIGEVVKRSSELALQAEGIQIAFERLGRGDILDGLREATHGTVSDLELMKAAVRFNDFKLPLDELGTMLAFAQQKAKDTGQSLDYMVESIVLGLGRQSKPIMDNLGISAKELSEKMKETGDFTKAAAAIIKEQMEKAGDYVETAADRAALSTVALQNEMTKLGTIMRDTFGYTGWTEFENGLKIHLIGVLEEAIEDMNRLKRAWNLLTGSVASGIPKNPPKQKGSGQGNKKDVVAAPGGYVEVTDGNGNVIGGRHFDNLDESAINAWASSLKRGGKGGRGRRGSGGGGGTTTTEKELNALQQIQKDIATLSEEALTADEERLDVIRETISGLQEQERILRERQDYATGKSTPFVMSEKSLGGSFQEMPGIADAKQAMLNKINSELTAVDATTFDTMLRTVVQNGIDGLDPDFETLQDKISQGLNIPDDDWQSLQDKINEKLAELNIDPIKIDFGTGKLADAGKDTKASWKEAAQAVQLVGSALSNIQDPAAKIASTIGMAIANVALAYSDTLAKDIGSKTNIFAFIASAAAAMVSMATTISAIHSATGYAEGGIVKGNSYSGDNIPADTFINAGELVLNRSQQSTLASVLQGGQQGRVGSSTPYVTGEMIVLGVNNWGKSTGKGQLVFSK